MTSHDVVAKVRRILNTKEVGHTGTLDPMAEGLLVLVLGQATKLSQYILAGDKSYRVGVRLGLETDTLDITGRELGKKEFDLAPGFVVAEANKLIGEFMWQVPQYSAMKVQGEKLYEKARRGEDFEAPQKLMKFWDVQERSRTTEGDFVFDLHCSKGSFIRTWVQKLGEVLGCGAAMSSLVRLSSNPFHRDKALGLEELSGLVGSTPTEWSGYVPLNQALPQYQKVKVKGQTEVLLMNGQISYDLRAELIRVCRPEVDDLIQVFDSEGELLSLIGVSASTGFQIRRVFPKVKKS